MVCGPPMGAQRGTAPAASFSPGSASSATTCRRPPHGGYGGVFEGLIGVTDHEVHSQAYAAAKKEADKRTTDVAYTARGPGRLVRLHRQILADRADPRPGGAVRHHVWSHWLDDNADRFPDRLRQATAPQTLAPGRRYLLSASRVFVGAKEVNLLDRYETARRHSAVSATLSTGAGCSSSASRSSTSSTG